jgi:Carboxypeptidase regulatory-like domain
LLEESGRVADLITVNSARKQLVNEFRGGSIPSRLLGPGRLVCLTLCLVICGFSTQARQAPTPTGPERPQGAATGTPAPTREQQPDPQSSGRISGRVVDPTGVAVPGAKVRLTSDDQSLDRQTQSDDDGQFSFADVAPGNFHATITSEGFATQTFQGSLRSGEPFIVPQIVLTIASAATEIRVVPNQVEVAEEQIKEQEKQRALGFIPNFYVSYIPNAAPLTPKQKFKLAAKTIVDPVTFGLTAAAAGLEQMDNDLGGYGQGAQGYAKRYGASYADNVTGTLIGNAILPSLLKQDPRYFYKGTGSKRSRVLYALAMSVVCKGDNGHWQTNYSGILGSLAAGGISNLYYPSHDRGAGLTFENTLIGIGTTAAANILQEFVIRKLTPNAPNPDPGNPSKPSSQISKILSRFVHEGD